MTYDIINLSPGLRQAYKCVDIQWLWLFIATVNNISVISALYCLRKAKYSEITIDLPQGSNKYYTQLCIEYNYLWVGIELTIIAYRKLLTTFNTCQFIKYTSSCCGIRTEQFKPAASPWQPLTPDYILSTPHHGVEIELTIVACRKSLITFNTCLCIKYASSWCGNRTDNLSLPQVLDNL